MTTILPADAIASMGATHSVGIVMLPTYWSLENMANIFKIFPRIIVALNA